MSVTSNTISVQWTNPKLNNTATSSSLSAFHHQQQQQPEQIEDDSLDKSGSAASVRDGPVPVAQAALVSNALARVWSADPDLQPSLTSLLSTSFGTGVGGTITLELPPQQGPPSWMYVTVEGFTADLHGNLRTAPRSPPVRVTRACEYLLPFASQSLSLSLSLSK